MLSAVTVIFLFMLGILTVIPGELLPDIDHWILSAAMALLVDVLAGLPLMIFVAAYWASAHPAHAPITGDPAPAPPT